MMQEVIGNILLVDDREENLLALAEVLEPLGQNLITALSGQEALDHILRDEEIALIVMDIRMPTMDGYETAALVRGREKSRHIPIIFITAFSDSQMDILKGYEVGAADYIIKPFVPEIVRSKVGVFVDLFKLRKATQMHLEEAAQLNRKLNRTNLELARSNRELEEFAYVVSHDLQEPLRAVTNYLGLLERRSAGQFSEDALRFIRHAVDGASRMRELITDLLDYSRVHTKEAAFGEVDSGTVLGRVMDGMKAAVEESGARVTHDDLPVVVANEFQLAQLLQNLIGNALKFRGAAQPRVHVSAAPQAGEWLFSVADNGIGVAPEHCERVFGLFQRLHTRSEYPGTGLGLAICKKIVERHGGRIWVKSIPGRGSTFFFTLPK
ncbi:MAG: ATP-binding protein [Smithellaceae bacterium]|nr:ATP-binding protein [Smithellaceae bacterium]